MKHALAQVDRRRGARMGGRKLPGGAVRPGSVVMAQVLSQYLAQVVLID